MRTAHRKGQRLVVVDANQLGDLSIHQPKSKPAPFLVSRTLIEQEIGFSLSKGTVVDHVYEDKALTGMLAVVKRWAKAKRKGGELPNAEEAVARFFADKKLAGHFRGLVERKAAGVCPGSKVRIFVPIHPDDPVKPAVLAIFTNLGKVFAEEELAKILKGITFVLCWVGQPMQKRAGVFALLGPKPPS